MKKSKAKALEAEGWKIGTVQDLLGLTDEESAFIEMKIALARALKEERARRGLSQTQVAARMESSQPRVAKIESGEATIDILVRALLAVGASPKEIGRKLASAAA